MESILYIRDFKNNNVGSYMYKYATLKNITSSNNHLFCNDKKFVDIYPNIKYKYKFKEINKYIENINKYTPIKFMNGISLSGNFYDTRYFENILDLLKTDFMINNKYKKNIFNLNKEEILDCTILIINKRENDNLTDITSEYYIDAIKHNDRDNSNNKYIIFIENGLEYIINDIKKEIKISILKEIKFNYLNYYYLFEIIRKSNKIILSNSLTFLWQCYLSLNDKDYIIMPKNWFTYKLQKYYNNNIIVEKFIDKFILIDNVISNQKEYFKNKIVKDKDFYKKYCVNPYLNPLDGIGSNMFTIATAYTLAKSNNCNIIINDKIPFHIDKTEKKIPLNICNIFPNLSCTTEDIIYPYKYYEHYSSNTPNIIEFKYGIELFGWFRSIKYFEKYREDLLKLFTFSSLITDTANILYGEIFKKYKNITCIHIRRGDYLKVTFVNTLDDNYYSTCLNDMISKKILENTYILIFVQDNESEEWVKNSNINKILHENKLKYEFINVNQYITLYLMTLCNNIIIANSTFSYMGAFLNINKNINVYCPYYWYNTKHIEYKYIESIEKYIYPENWIKINNKK